MKSLITTAAIFAFSGVNAAGYDYKQNGKDWKDISGYSACGATNQSPINLYRKGSNDFDYIEIDADEDELAKVYSNQKGVVNTNNGHTVQVGIKPEEATNVNMFSSMVSPDVYGGPEVFDGQQFHFHSGSEHTVDGKRFDLEMHTVHYPKKAGVNGFIAAAVGIIFDINDYTATLTKAEEMLIDNFFDSLKWSEMGSSSSTTANLDYVIYGDLMEMVDSRNRWTYRGSVTTPPCATAVYWNVLSTVYPIK